MDAILTSNAQLCPVFNSPFEAGPPLGKNPVPALDYDTRSMVHASQKQNSLKTIVAFDIITSNLHFQVIKTFTYHCLAAINYKG